MSLKIVIAPDKFKGSLTATEAAQAIRRGVLSAAPDAQCRLCPMADGGEGTVDVFLERGATRKVARVRGPLGTPVDAAFALDNDTAILEMAGASGLGLLERSQYDPAHTDTFGTGQLIEAALDAGARRLIIGIGGSATNDAGTGMLRALGVRFLDKQGVAIDGGILDYERLETIDPSGIDERIAKVAIEVAVDVDNPLCGPNGATRTFAAQKGATPDQIERLDHVLGHIADVADRALSHDYRNAPGAGAAGGLGFALMAFLDAKMQPGVQLIARECGLDKLLTGATLCMTGEGKIDLQTLHGKTVDGVAKLASERGVAVVAFGGAVEKDAAERLAQRGIEVVAIAPPGTPIEESMRSAARFLEAAAKQVVGVDAAALDTELRLHVKGEVRFDNSTRAMYSTDASNYRQVPIGLVLPKDPEDVEHTLAACRRFGAPVFSRGGGTSLAGEACNAAIVMDFSKYMNRILEIDWEGKSARVQPGCVNDDLRNLAERRNLTFGPDPATHNRNTFGGMIGNNSCGMHAQMAGKTEENVEELEIVTYDGLRMRVGRTSDEELERIIAGGGRRGEIYGALKALRDKYADKIREKFPDIPRRVSGFPLNELLPENGFNVARALVGTESTCVTIVEAKVRLVHSPPYRAIVILGFPDLGKAADQVPFCNEHQPVALEGISASMFQYLELKGEPQAGQAMFPDGKAWLICEFGGETKEEAAERAHGLMNAFRAQPNPPTMNFFADQEEQRQFWMLRDDALGATSKVPNQADYYPGWEDSAVDPERLGDYLRRFQQMLDEYGYQGSIYGHFGQACVHVSINFDLFTAAGIAKYREFVTKMAHICVEHGGSLSGEHGDGQARGELLPIMYGDELVEAFWEFKSIWDPQHRMNPGKVVHPYRLDQDLRWGTEYEPWEPQTHFTFEDDHGSFAFAANRCVGTGKCRKHDAGTMCPSYMATLEEAYSTRGRARLLFEMLEGNPIDKGWQDEGVKDALDFCLSCKGCKGECPVNVDMATYKAEFLSHYYEHKRRPISAYAFGLMFWWARLASLAPGFVNALTQTPGTREIAKAVVSIAPQRAIPLFSGETFRDWFAKRPPRNVGREEVILWPDTWNNHFHPTTAQAAVEVLERAGFHVTIPAVQLCCGRPLYDYGMLDLAKTMLRDVLEALRPQIRAGTCIVGLEPSCVSVFRDEMTNLLGPDEDARRLKEQTCLFSDFLAKKAPHLELPQLNRKALVQEHCHHKSVLDTSGEKKLFDALGLDYEIPDTGCCGMAGPFGFDASHYDVSMKIGERVLLPRVRAADERTIIVADGFSCREQIAQSTNRQALHPAQVLKMAFDDRGHDRTDARPELRYMPHARKEARLAALRGVVGAAALVGAVAAAAALFIRKR